MAKLYMGFDAGTQSVKVAVYDESLTPLAQATAATTLHYPHPGWVQMDPDEFLSITLTCMKRCTDEIRGKGYDPADIRAVMGDGIICGICGVNAEGDAVTPYINYLDSRTQADADAINAKNLDIWGKETGNPEANCMFPALFARWFIKNSRKFREKGVKFVHNAPYILMHLAGLKGKDAFIDWGAMSGWGLGYKVEEKCWSDEQLAILGIDKRFMPAVKKPWDVVGTVSQDIARVTGLAAGTPVCAGAGDTMPIRAWMLRAPAPCSAFLPKALSRNFLKKAAASFLIPGRCRTPTFTGALSAQVVWRSGGLRTISAARPMIRATTRSSRKKL